MAETRRVNMLDRPPKAEQVPPVLTLTSVPVVAPTVSPADAYPIDTDVPIPRKPGKQGRVVTFPWERLEVGHSFLVPGEKTYKTANFWCKWAMREWPDRRFVYRKMENGVRIWRVEVTKK
jgi:hypothetical protein